jgi:hypothetical protein
VSYLYNVYAHPERGQWGFTAVTADKDVKTAFIDGRDGTVTLGRLEPLKVGPALQRNLRSGYRKAAQAKYLHLSLKAGRQAGEFVTQHPDLGLHLRGDRIFFVAVPDGLSMTEVAGSWIELLEDCTGNGTARDAWMKHCQSATSYIPAMSEDAHAALLIAQWARDNNLMLVCDEGELPRSSPSRQRHEWRGFLRRWINESKVDEALAELGWALNEAIAAAPSLAINSTTPAGDEWTALAQQASF